MLIFAADEVGPLLALEDMLASCGKAATRELFAVRPWRVARSRRFYDWERPFALPTCSFIGSRVAS